MFLPVPIPTHRPTWDMGSSSMWERVKYHWPKTWRALLVFGCPLLIIYLGDDCTAHIRELYDGLCPDLQGPGMKVLLYNGDSQGNCTGIGDQIYLLTTITWIAAGCSAALLMRWYKRE